jgi:microsomal dipeptidase-like Zn-dependent dipeptidase
VIASHSCIQGIKDHPHNLTDIHLQALKRNGGVVQVNLVPDHLREPVDVP